MFVPKKMILKLAIGMLALTVGCGDDPGVPGGSTGIGGTGGTVNNELTNALRGWCMKVQECSVPEIRVELCVEHAERLRGDGGACEAASISYGNCIGGLEDCNAAPCVDLEDAFFADECS